MLLPPRGNLPRALQVSSACLITPGTTHSKQGSSSLQRLPPTRKQTASPPLQSHLPTFSGGWGEWAGSPPQDLTPCASVAHHLGSEAFQPAEPSSDGRPPPPPAETHLTPSLQQAKTSLLVNRFLDIGRIILRLGRVTLQKLSPVPDRESGPPGEVTALVTLASFLAETTLRFCKETLRRAESRGQQAGRGFTPPQLIQSPSPPFCPRGIPCLLEHLSP